MLNIKRVLKTDRSMKSLTGLSIDEFVKLTNTFEQSFYAYRKKIGMRVNFGRPHKLQSMEEKLFFILFYIKTYPTYDTLAIMFDADKHRVHDWVQELKEVLKMALDKEIVMPKRKIRSLEELFRLIPEIKEVWVDGTERPIRRPKDTKKQKKKYSGKKKRHTNKNLIITNKKKQILYVSRTVSGKEHDYTLFKKTKLAEAIPKGTKVWLDCGFQGIQKDFPDIKVAMPKRASRGHALTESNKLKNKKISSKRVLVENSICGIKRLRSLTDVFRGWYDSFSDDLIAIGAGLWNYHLKMK